MAVRQARHPAVRRDRPDLAVANFPAPTDLAESWQVNLTDELTRRDRTAQGRFDPAAFTHNALHQVTNRTGALPASYTWDVDGNLSTRTGGLYGDASFTHDWRDRLVQLGQGSATTDIVLDPLGRMVGKVRHTPNGDVARAYLHDGDQVVLEYVQPAGGTTWQPERRHMWARWIDDLALEQVDTDGDGSLDATLYPVTDLLGSVQLLTEESGTPVERITYDPDGTPHFWRADTTRPTATRIAWTGDGATPTGDTVTAQALELGFSEPIDPASATDATATLTPDGGDPQTLTLTLAADGRTAYLTGATVHQAGTQYTLHVDGLTDTTHNPIWPEDATVTIADPNAYEVLDDATAPKLLAVLDGTDALYLLFDEPVEPAAGYDMTTALSIVRQGQQLEGNASLLTASLLEWQPGGGVGGLVHGGTYTINGVHLTDLAGNPATAGATVTHLNTSDQMLLLAYQAPTDTQGESQSAYGLTPLFQGRTWHGDLGMYYYRNRWYLPEAGVFAERDPIDPSESVNLYGYLEEDPANLLDPTGKQFTDWGLSREYEVPRERTGGFLTVGISVDAWAASTVPTGPADIVGLFARSDKKGIHLGVDWQFWIRRKGTTLVGTFAYDNLDAASHRVDRTGQSGPFGHWGILGGGGSVSAGVNVAYYLGKEKNGYWDLEDPQIIKSWAGEFKDVSISLPAFSIGAFWSSRYLGVAGSGGPLSLGIGAEASITYYRSTTVGTELGRWKTFILDSLAGMKGAATNVTRKAQIKVSKAIDDGRNYFRRLLESSRK